MTIPDIPLKIHDFPFWLYQFNLDGHTTPAEDSAINRHAWNREKQRKSYFFDPLVKLFGGTLAGKRVLDLGCNAGFWSLCALEAGCDFVLGIDARMANLAQAQLVFDVKKVDRDRYRLVRGNILQMDFQQFGKFDIVLCLNLLYHIHQPVTIFEKIAQVNGDVLVIDTIVSQKTGCLFELRGEPRDTRPATILSADSDLVLIPTRQAVIETAQYFGYKAVVLKPKFTSYEGAGGYRRGERRAFFCARQTEISKLPADVEPIHHAANVLCLHGMYVRKAWNEAKRHLKRTLRFIPENKRRMP